MNCTTVRYRDCIVAFVRLNPRRFAARAESTNGVEPCHYDFDLFTGGVRASRFATNFGASVAVCELPFATISSETTGGVGGTKGDTQWRWAIELREWCWRWEREDDGGGGGLTDTIGNEK
ncbi:hypothetical protein L1987_87482 [Smallanthus sonchifolius]|nr:hypothetical protein L1987_87482 [Smallanthus sonchifolius]